LSLALISTDCRGASQRGKPQASHQGHGHQH
jgi:hypothetical protein